MAVDRLPPPRQNRLEGFFFGLSWLAEDFLRRLEALVYYHPVLVRELLFFERLRYGGKLALDLLQARRRGALLHDHPSLDQGCVKTPCCVDAPLQDRDR